jgi:hypothetical protein
LPSLQTSGVPAAHEPLWQVSLPLQTVPSAHGVPSATALVVQPKTGSQASVVHGLPSLHVGGAPAVHTPDWQVSLPLQALPSGHAVPFTTGVARQPLSGAQLSVVQPLPSLQASGVPAVQAPLWQVSLPLQTLASEQAVPSAAGIAVQPTAGLQPSVVHGLPSLQVSGAPVVHVPP